MDTAFPKHVGFIMDGNRRWARKNRLQLLLGHENGVRRIEPLVELAAKKGIQYVTFWAFSTENWHRSKEEVVVLLDVFRKALSDPMMNRLKKNGVLVKVIGDISLFPRDIQERVGAIIDGTKNNDKITANFALNYGGRDEILRAVKNLMKDNVPEVTEDLFSSYLYTKGQPDPDLIIRTGGEMRMSGFMPWQSVYAEWYFSNVLWPDFTPGHMEEVLEDFLHNRKQNFGR